MLPMLMVVLDTSVVNVSLDHIRGSLSAGIDEATWSITAYLASNAVIIPMTGWISRLVGRKRYLIFSIIMFTLSSFLCGISWNIESLIVFRILQGLSGGAMPPLSQAILLESFPPHQYGMAMAIFGIGVSFGPIIGPVLGGWITEALTWHWVFFINIPIGIVSVIMAVFVVVDPPYMKGMRMKIDYAGLMLLGLGWHASSFSWIGASGLTGSVRNSCWASRLLRSSLLQPSSWWNAMPSDPSSTWAYSGTIPTP
jgi:DHA2 family multidrug resistance protein